MKKILLFFIAIAVFSSCKEKSNSEKSEDTVALSVPEKIAMAHGFENWPDVKEIQFTFNVDRDTVHFERSWIWQTGTNKVSMILKSDTTTYHRAELDSTLLKVDAGFINDKYWLLAPFNLIWDKDSFEYEHSENVSAPISKKPMQKLTIVYGNEGGYTPGDAYDFFFEDDYIIKEWVFRKSNQPEPSTITTWEDYVTIGGLRISRMHKKSDASWNLSFTKLTVN